MADLRLNHFPGVRRRSGRLPVSPVVTVIVVAWFAIALALRWEPFRATLSLVAVLVVPGLALGSLLVGRRVRPAIVPAGALVGSLAVLAVGGVLVNLVLGELHPGGVLVLVAVLVAIAVPAHAVHRPHVPPAAVDRRNLVPVAAMGVAVAIAAAAVAAVGRVAPQPRAMPATSAAWIGWSDAGSAVAAGAAGDARLPLAVTSHEGTTRLFRITARTDDGHTWAEQRFVLDDGGHWQGELVGPVPACPARLTAAVTADDRPLTSLTRWIGGPCP